MRRLQRTFITATLLLALAFSLMLSVAAHDVDHPAVKVRVIDYDLSTHTYTFSCEAPQSSPGSQISETYFYAIDPVPQGHERSYRSTEPFITWDLDPLHYEEIVHTKAMYHIYCEVQNYSAPPGEQNMASEVHVDLRTDDNIDVPDIYVLNSEGTQLKLKCDPPDGVRDYTLSWAMRNRQGSTSLPHLSNQQIVNVTLPQAGSGWDIACTVFDKFTGKTSTWDMPLEVFEHGPAYVPTIEGCMPNEPCYHVDPSGIPPRSTFSVSTAPSTRVYINEVLKGTTDGQGKLTISIEPGVYNLVLRKQGYEDLSTLVPLAAGATLSKSYALQSPPSPPDRWNMCHDSIYSLPVNCTGTVASDTTGGGCRTILCEQNGNSLKVQACGKGSYFEMYSQQKAGSGVKICLGELCMQNEGYLRSENFPICLGNPDGPPACTSTTETCDDKDNDCDGQIDEGDVCEEPPLCTPVTEVCNQQDDDCDGQIDENNICASPQDTCYSAMKEIPASCEGGTITEDTSSGAGRTIQCGATKVQAWEKNGFFEMYKQSGGSSIRICIGETCIKESGYAKSAHYPICIDSEEPPVCTPTTEVCDQKDNDCDGQADENNVCGSTPPGEVCYAKVKDLPVTCAGGTTTSDSGSGCRTVICESGSGSMKAMACDKPTTSNPAYYEVYKQAQAGSGVTKICFGDACVSNGGYAKADFPYCTVSNGTNTSSVTLAINEKFTADHAYVFQCNATGFSPERYAWNFGDGITAVRNATRNYIAVPYTEPPQPEGNYSRNDVMHAYAANGTYTVTCTAINGGESIQAMRQITVSTPQFPANLNNPQEVALSFQHIANTTYAVSCNDIGFEAQYFKFEGDGPNFSYHPEKNGNSTPSRQFTFPGPGSYTIGCYAYTFNYRWAPIFYQDVVSTGCTSQFGCMGMSRSITIEVPNQTLPPNQTACYNRISELPASCSGSITTDSSSGTCRTIECAGASGSVKTLSCEKTDSGGMFFEMYKQSATGTAPEVCIGETCLRSGWGYQKGSSFPVCMTNTTAPTNETPRNVTNTTVAATVNVEEEHSADHNIILDCAVKGFIPSLYEWSFGDGQSAVKNTSNWPEYAADQNVQKWHHTYLRNGTYEVTCRASDGYHVVQGATTVEISTPATEEQILESWIVPDFHYELIDESTARVTCNVHGIATPGADINSYADRFSYSTYSWGPIVYDITFPEGGTYAVYCISGSNNNYDYKGWYNEGRSGSCSNPRSICISAQGTLTVTVPGSEETNGGPIAVPIPGEENTYNMSCRAYGLTNAHAHRYWDYGDGEWDGGYDTTFVHSFPDNGMNYSVMCRYTDTVSYWKTLNEIVQD